MMRFYWQRRRVHLFISLFLILFLGTVTDTFSSPVEFTDSAGNHVFLSKPPERVVSLVPSITEIIFRIGAGSHVRGVTYHSTTYPPGAGKKEIVGGFFSPSIRKIISLRPDVIFVSKFHEKLIPTLSRGPWQVIDLETNSISDSYRNILLLGKIFNREEDAEKIVEKNQEELKFIVRKVAMIPESKRKRVIRLMGRDRVMTPGDDSFQNEMIRAAGGIPPRLGKKGNVITVTKEEWIAFNPQVIYGCEGDRIVAQKFFNRPGWRDVDAVKKGRIFYFPCVLTCRAATNTGYFVTWLSARIYQNEFSRKENQVFADSVFKMRRLPLTMANLKGAHMVYSRIHDFVNKTLVLDLVKPVSVISTLEGLRRDIRCVGNHYFPPPCWGLGHNEGLEKMRYHLLEILGRSGKNTSLLFTGADMDRFAVVSKRFRKIEVMALVTAGVTSNALRMSRDKGSYYEPGTINIILLNNCRLTPRALTRAVITATEAKTAALEDLDIRSSYTSRTNQATGTGTDNIIVVQGTGDELDNAGGHSKLGELIARAVYEGVRKAIFRQNGLDVPRNIFERLKERKINIYDLVAGIDCGCVPKKNEFAAAVEDILLEPMYAGFMESTLQLSDCYEKGLVTDIYAYRSWCHTICSMIAGRDVVVMKDFVEGSNMPVVLKDGLNAIMNGVFQRYKNQGEGY